MDTKDFVCFHLGIDGKVIDNICEEFDVDIREEDLCEALREYTTRNTWAVGQSLLISLLGKIIKTYEGVLDADKFDYDFSSPSYPIMYYDEERFTTKKELDAIAKN